MSHRESYIIKLRPLTGDRFQPTGFPDIGAAVYDRPVVRDGRNEWERCLLVESEQSMANHLEAAAWDKGNQRPVEALSGLPYVRVVNEKNDYLTSSRTEAHRLASAFLKDSTLQRDGTSFVDHVVERFALENDAPLVPRKIAPAIFALDPMCLIHGVFFADKKWPHQPKIARALTAFVEAHDVLPVITGGVKRDEVRHSVSEGAGGAGEGYGSIPFHRTEYVARDIQASFVIDHDQLVAYGLGDAATKLLATLARWEIRSLLDGGFRPRTACDLVPVDASAISLPTLDELTDNIRALIGECSDLVGEGKEIAVKWSRKAASKRAQRTGSQNAGEVSESDSDTDDLDDAQ
ncbi:MAG: type I-U CRISPR-associated RAMP protein Csb1/Cas7u [Actinobacteria bacterium]|nr:type I-U CRISPR-associated RAMP protein Csb1/Cas7u [Actinomycetota bacterium]